MSFYKENETIGLALGGGAALGAVHVGVLKALDELKIPIHYITGTSIGAIVASMYAFEKDLDTLEKIALDLNWLEITKLSVSKFGLFSNGNLKKFLQKTFGDVTFEQATTPFSVVTTDSHTGKKVVINSGNVADAVMASSAIPGLYQPVRINDQQLVDGGIVENVPMSTLLEYTPNHTIAVDLTNRTNSSKPSQAINLLYNCFHFMLSKLSDEESKKAEFLIAPDLSNFVAYDTSQTKKLITIGYETTYNLFSGQK